MALLGGTAGSLLGMNIIMEGIGDPMKVLPALNNAMNQAAVRGSKEVAQEVAEIARREVPIGATGALHGSIQVARMGNQWGVTAGGPDAPYATYVEYGTMKMNAQPFLRPAIAEVIQSAKGVMAKAIWSDPQLAAVRAAPFARPLGVLSTAASLAYPAASFAKSGVPEGGFAGNVAEPGAFSGKFSGAIAPEGSSWLG